MSESAFVAAIRPQSYASSTTGVKKSVVSTYAGPPSGAATTAASSPVSSPTSSAPYASGGARAGPGRSPASTASSSPGGILHAHPPPWAYCVRRTRVDGWRSEVPAVMTMRPLSGADPRRRIPATDALLAVPELAAAADRLGRAVVKQAVVAAQAQARRGDIAPEQVAAVAIDALPSHATSLVRVVNATGVIIHTNLGRAPLS